MSRFYITTAIDYANGEPHIGHAYEKVGADAIARWRRIRGDDVHFLVGMDEHGQTVAQKAAERGLTPQQLVDGIAPLFEAMWARLGITHDQFVRTTAPAHHAGVQALIARIFERHPDDFYEQQYRGRYCVGCEAFKQDAEIVEGKCVNHPTRELEWVEERNWFFRLSRYRDVLRAHFAAHPDFLQPESRRNEILALLEAGLDDISASRSRFAWGVPFPRPLSTGEPQTTYVWFDALPNYLTATGFPAAGFETRWPAQLHVIGKDITRFHCVIWPAMLAAADLPLPERVWAHGFISFKGQKLSKSAGVVIDLEEAVTRHGPDAFRYFLLREVGWDADGSFTWERFDERYTADLADAFGNLVSRVLAMLDRYRSGIVPEAPPTELDAFGDRVVTRYTEAMDGFLLHRGAQAAWELVFEANAYVDRRAPWAAARRGDDTGLDETLGALARCLTRLAVLTAPFIPGAADRLWSALGLGDGMKAQNAWPNADRPSVASRKTSRIAPLFPKPERPPAAP
jgi:methionyl-tRNA synthetase